MSLNKEEDAEEVVEEKESFKPIKSKIEVLDLVYHPSEERIVTGHINGKIKVYQVSNEKKRLVSFYKLHKKSIRKIAFSHNDSNIVFSASKDKSIKLFDLKHETDVLNLEKAHEKPINTFTVIDHWLVASGDDDGCVKIWDYRRKKAVMESNDCQDYISDFAVSKDGKILLATSGEGTLSAFHTKKKKLELQSELMDSELLCVTFMKAGAKVVCGTGEGVLDIFNNDEWGNISDRFPGHPSSIDCLCPLNDNIVLTGCFDGNIRACHVLPNRFMGIIGNHENFPIIKLALSPDRKTLASIAHDEYIRFWNIDGLDSKVIQASSKSDSKKLKNKKIGKNENFFSDLIEEKNDGDKDSDESGSDDSEDFSDSDASFSKSDDDSLSSDDSDEKKDKKEVEIVSKPTPNLKSILKKRLNK